MKTLQIILFLVANAIFLTQIGRHAHQVAFGTERSVIAQFERDYAEKERAREQKDDRVLIEEYRVANETVRELEKGKKKDEMEEIRRLNEPKYDLKNSLRDEIQERERRRREVRDIWLYAGFGMLLIVAGAFVYLRGAVWPGFGVVVTGFIELEYWASPTFFGGVADSEYHTLLINKLVLSLIALGMLYIFWALRTWPNITTDSSGATPRRV